MVPDRSLLGLMDNQCTSSTDVMEALQAMVEEDSDRRPDQEAAAVVAHPNMGGDQSEASSGALLLMARPPTEAYVVYASEGSSCWGKHPSRGASQCDPQFSVGTGARSAKVGPWFVRAPLRVPRCRMCLVRLHPGMPSTQQASSTSRRSSARTAGGACSSRHSTCVRSRLHRASSRTTAAPRASGTMRRPS